MGGRATLTTVATLELRPESGGAGQYWRRRRPDHPATSIDWGSRDGAQHGSIAGCHGMEHLLRPTIFVDRHQSTMIHTSTTSSTPPVRDHHHHPSTAFMNFTSKAFRFGDLFLPATGRIHCYHAFKRFRLRSQNQHQHQQHDNDSATIPFIHGRLSSYPNPIERHERNRCDTHFTPHTIDRVHSSAARVGGFWARRGTGAHCVAGGCCRRVH